jgi:hypothetical protein
MMPPMTMGDSEIAPALRGGASLGRLLRFGLLFSALLALASCGDDDAEDPHAYEASCDHACTRVHECDSTMAIATCSANCKDDASDIGPRLSGQFLAGLDSCIDGLNCVQLSVSNVFQTCQREVSARLAPSPAAEDLCDAVVASIQMCTGLSVGTAGCLDAVKIYADSALHLARACADMSCDQRTACVQDALGTDVTAPTMTTP